MTADPAAPSDRATPGSRDLSVPPATGTRGADLGLLALAVIWGTNFSVIKVALEEIAPLAFNALRFPLASLALLVLLRLRGPLRLPQRRDLPRVVVLGLVGNVLYQVLFIYGVDATTAGNASLLLATTPAWTILLSVGLGHEHPARRVWVGILATLAGMVLVVAGGEGVRLGGASLVGDVLMAAAAMGWSVYTVGARDLIHRYGALAVTAWTLWVGTVGVVLLGIPSLAELAPGRISAIAWMGVAYSGVLSISLAYLIWYNGVRRLGNARTSVYSNLVPVVALGVAWIWLGEIPTGLQLAGAAVVLGGITLARLPARRRR
ncbi:MAG: DMT family transporter [Gemmatimonadetes bacterium]|nr:DMT family transporter [Gemmatimonadota bacterium]